MCFALTSSIPAPYPDITQSTQRSAAAGATLAGLSIDASGTAASPPDRADAAHGLRRRDPRVRARRLDEDGERCLHRADRSRLCGRSWDASELEPKAFRAPLKAHPVGFARACGQRYARLITKLGSGLGRPAGGRTLSPADSAALPLECRRIGAGVPRVGAVVGRDRDNIVARTSIGVWRIERRERECG
jgi:hypothetical protein